MPDRKYNVGQRVRAKWPGSSLYYEGVVEDFNDTEYLVSFDDEDESKLAIKYKDVGARDAFRRSRSRSRGRSPSRKTKSPSRKTMSPSRKTMSPSRKNKSPGRKPKSPGRAPSESPSINAIAKSEITKLNLSTNSSKGSKSPPRASSRLVNSSVSSAFSINSRSSNEDKHQLAATTTSTTLRQSVRSSALDKASNDLAATRSTPVVQSSSSNTKKSSGTTKVKAFFTSIWSVLVPAVTALPFLVFIAAAPLFLTLSCTKKKCTLLELPELSYKLSHYYDTGAIGIALGLMALHVVLAFVPISSRILPNGTKARHNGLLTFSVLCLLFPLGHYLKQDVTRPYVLLRPLIVTHTVLGIILGLVFYVKSYYAPRSQHNPRTVGHFLPDFIEGREVNPRIGSLDIKSFFFKHSMIISALYLVVMAIREFKSKSSEANYNHEFFLLIGLQLFYILDILLFEDGFFTTWEYTRQGFGYFVTGFYLTMPYYCIINPRIVSFFRAPLPWYCLSGITILFLAGYILQRGSNNQKHAFRSNPSSPSLAHLESVPTSAGTRLLVSGWWGVIRHPNYLGDILIQLSLCLLCGFQRGLPWLNFALVVASLIHRIYENEQSCARKYGLSWNTYTGRVKYRLVPRVF